MCPTISNACWRNCGSHSVSHAHVFWDKVLEEVFHQNGTKDPGMAIPGVGPEGAEDIHSFFFRLSQLIRR